MQKVKLIQLHKHAKMPVYATKNSNAADIFACIDEPIGISVGQAVLIPTGFAMEVPEGYGAYLLPRSGLGHKHGIVLGNLVGLIDTDYRGQVMVSIWNRSGCMYIINPGDRIAQMCIIETPQFEFEWSEILSVTERGAGGFGSTGAV